MAKTQINLYVDPSLSERMDALIQQYNTDSLFSTIHSRGELLEMLVSSMERYYKTNDEIKSFFDRD